MRNPEACALLATIALAALPASAVAQERPKEKLQVAVSILPQAYFVERVGGECVDVEVLVGPGDSPHSYEPTPKQMANLAEARVYFTIGVEFEKAFLPRVRRMFEDLRVVETRTGVSLRRMASADQCRSDHDHGVEHGPQHEGGHDPHIWLSPTLVKIQAQTICDTLVELDPARAEPYRRNLAAFHADLDRVHAQIAAVLAPLEGKEIFVFHPAYGYFTDEFGLKQVPVQIEGKQPTARRLAQLIDRAKAANVKIIFVQPQFSRKSADAVAQAIGGVVVPINPLARDYLGNLQEMAARIEAGLRQHTPRAGRKRRLVDGG